MFDPQITQITQIQKYDLMEWSVDSSAATLPFFKSVESVKSVEKCRRICARKQNSKGLLRREKCATKIIVPLVTSAISASSAFLPADCGLASAAHGEGGLNSKFFFP